MKLIGTRSSVFQEYRVIRPGAQNAKLERCNGVGVALLSRASSLPRLTASSRIKRGFLRCVGLDPLWSRNDAVDPRITRIGANEKREEVAVTVWRVRSKPVGSVPSPLEFALFAGRPLHQSCLETNPSRGRTATRTCAELSPPGGGRGPRRPAIRGGNGPHRARPGDWC
jgi:hypothetical protein